MIKPVLLNLAHPSYSEPLKHLVWSMFNSPYLCSTCVSSPGFPPAAAGAAMEATILTMDTSEKNKAWNEGSEYDQERF
jgi:hypothetical protein